MVTGKAVKVNEKILKKIEDNREHPRETYSDILERLLKINKQKVLK